MEHCVIERRQCEARVFGRAQAPAQDPARVAIQDHGQVAPRAADLQVGDVADPDLIRRRRQTVELAIGNAGKEPVQAGNAPVELGRPGAQPRLAHEPPDAPAADPDAGRAQRAMDSRAAIGPSAPVEDLPDRVDGRGPA